MGKKKTFFDVSNAFVVVDVLYRKFHCFFFGHYVTGRPDFFYLKNLLKKVIFWELGRIEKKENQFEKAFLFC